VHVYQRSNRGWQAVVAYQPTLNPVWISVADYDGDGRIESFVIDSAVEDEIARGSVCPWCRQHSRLSDSPLTKKDQATALETQERSKGNCNLTQREVQVVQLAAIGMTAARLGHELSISKRTVETHLAHAYRRLGVASRLELISWLSSGSETDAKADLELGSSQLTKEL
jgi:DNA-binding CsgD family transcriptional regulator